MSPEQKIVQYLNEAHATEQALTRVLQSQIAMTPRGSYRSALETHLAETHDHARRVQRRLSELGEGTQHAAVRRRLRRERRRPGASRSARRRSTSCAATAAPRRCSRTPRTPPRPRRWRSRPTRRSSAWPRPPATSKTAQLAASILADEEKMLARVLREIPKLTEAVLGGKSFDIATTGAGETVKRAAEGDQARRAPDPQGPGRRAGRGPGQGRRGVRERPRDRALRHADRRRDPQPPVRSSRRSTWPRSTPTSAGTRTARRCWTASPRCAATSRGRATTSSTSSEIRAALAEADDDRLRAVRTLRARAQGPHERARRRRARARDRLSVARPAVRDRGPVRVRTSPMSQIQEYGADDDLPLRNYDRQSGEAIAAKLRAFSQRELRADRARTRPSTSGAPRCSRGWPS